MAITGDYNSVIIVPSNPTKIGYSFSGWSPVFPTMMPAGSTTLVAQWTLIPVVTPSVPELGWFAGWGAWSNPIKDFCPNGDYTESYYDGKCGVPPTIATWVFEWTTWGNECLQPDYTLNSFNKLTKSIEKKKFIVCWLYSNKQTIFDNVPEFNYNRIVTREEASKMIGRFVKNILNKEPIRKKSDKKCNFIDLNQSNSYLVDSIKESCLYGVFNGTSSNKFLPKQNLTQAHAIATVLRSAYGYQDELWSNPWFKPYVTLIQDNNVKRKWLRISDNVIDLQNKGITRWNLGEFMYKVAIDIFNK